MLAFLMAIDSLLRKTLGTQKKQKKGIKKGLLKSFQ